MARQRLTYALALVLVVTTAVVSGGNAVTAADTNGDRHVDVLDVQTVVAQVLDAAAPNGAADVNADGRIDILDLQRIVAQATHADAPTKELPVDPNPEAAMPGKTAVPLALALASRPGLLLREVQARLVCRGAGHDHIAALPAHTERYLFTLTPHAPPGAHSV